MIIGLRRHSKSSKALKKFLGAKIGDNNIDPTINCMLGISDIENCNITDKDPNNPGRQQIISRGIIIKEKEIYIGSFSFHENPYEITLEVKRVNLVIKDE